MYVSDPQSPDVSMPHLSFPRRCGECCGPMGQGLALAAAVVVAAVAAVGIYYAYKALKK